MTIQAQNTQNICRGASIASIKQALRMQKPSIVDELMSHYSAKSVDDLALTLSKG